MTDKEFHTFHDEPFKPWFEKLIEFKRGKGEHVTRSVLAKMRRVNNALPDHGTLVIDRNTAEAVLSVLPEESLARAEHVSLMRQLVDFMRAHGVQGWPIPRGWGGRVTRPLFKPYIFTQNELHRLILVADSMTPTRNSPYFHLVYPVITRLLIGTGLRIGEALSLTFGRVDWDTGVLSVITSKNGVSRRVPVSESLLATLLTYRDRLPARGADRYLFESPRTGSRYSWDAMKYAFYKMFDLAGIRTGEGKRPRIHDLRHDFCTKSLNQMLIAGMNTYTALPILSAYVGHVNLVDTERYLHFTEHFYEGFLADQQSLRALIPEVGPA